MENTSNNERKKKLQAKIEESWAVLKKMETSDTLSFNNLVKLKNCWIMQRARFRHRSRLKTGSLRQKTSAWLSMTKRNVEGE